MRQDQATIHRQHQAILEYTTIRSPLDGRTGIRQVDPGNIVQANGCRGSSSSRRDQTDRTVFTLAQQNLRAVTRGAGARPAEARARQRQCAHGRAGQVRWSTTRSTGDRHGEDQGGVSGMPACALAGQFVNVRLTVDTIRNAIVAPTARQRGRAAPMSMS